MDGSSKRAHEGSDGKRSLDNLVSATGGKGLSPEKALAAQTFYQMASVVQWWFFNVVVVISNKYIFQVRAADIKIVLCAATISILLYCSLVLPFAFRMLQLT
jgi:hypothetical protein